MYIALEIDQPFGNDFNDLPVSQMQRDFNRSLLELLDPIAQKPPEYKFVMGRETLKVSSQSGFMGLVSQKSMNLSRRSAFGMEPEYDDPSKLEDQDQDAEAVAAISLLPSSLREGAREDEKIVITSTPGAPVAKLPAPSELPGNTGGPPAKPSADPMKRQHSPPSSGLQQDPSFPGAVAEPLAAPEGTRIPPLPPPGAAPKAEIEAEVADAAKLASNGTHNPRRDDKELNGLPGSLISERPG